MANQYGNVARTIARLGAARYRPPRPYKRQPPRNILRGAVQNGPPVTQTPTVTATGVTTVTGGDMPGAPPASTIPGVYQAPKIKNWKKATPAQIAQAMLAPQYASLYAQQHQSQLMAGQQQAAITGYGADLAKILGGTGPTGAHGTLPPEYAAALSMSNLRNFAYQQFLESQKFADEYSKIAAQYPTYLNNILAQKADQQLKQDAFNLQKLVAAQTYHLNLSKANAYNQATNARIGLETDRVKLSQRQYNLAVAKANQSAAQWNAEQQNKASTIDLQASKAAGKWVNSQGQVITNVPFRNPPPPYYKPSAGGKGGSNPIDRTASKELGYWAYKDLSRVPPRVLKAKGLPNRPPSRYQPSSGSKGSPGLRGLTQTQYRSAWADAVAGVSAADEAGASYQQYAQKAVENRVPRWVAKKAWNRYHKVK